MVKRRGRPTKLTPEISAQISLLARRGCTNQEIADLLRVNESTLYAWKKNPNFSKLLKKSKEIADEAVVASLYDMAVGFKVRQETLNKNGEVVEYEQTVLPNVTAAIFWLKNRCRDEWRDREGSSDGAALVLAVVQKIVQLVPDPKKQIELADALENGKSIEPIPVPT